MTIEEKVNHWLALSNEDFEVAGALLKMKRNLYVGFMCHQSVEKLFKGCFVKLLKDTPPFKHDLVFFAQKVGFFDLLSEEQKSFLRELNPLNIEARYPDYKNEIARYLTDDTTKWVYEQTKELLQWTKEKILL
ncbi:MAG: HEPN domain-containing protein [Chitinivibrionia bacterium]|nr:HEPN domain-containing protein [Chitinivibrionia bacterium]